MEGPIFELQPSLLKQHMEQQLFFHDHIYESNRISDPFFFLSRQYVWRGLYSSTNNKGLLTSTVFNITLYRDVNSMKA